MNKKIFNNLLILIIASLFIWFSIFSLTIFLNIIFTWSWNWNIILSVGTLLVATFAIFQDIIVKKIQKKCSKLKINKGKIFPQKGNNENVYYGRVLVKNTGLFSLKNVEAMVVKLETKNFLPCPSLWTHFPQGGGRPIINPNQNVYLDLCFKHINSQNVPMLAIKEGRGIYSNLKKGINKLNIVLFADNGYNETFYCEVHWEGGEEFKIEFN